VTSNLYRISFLTIQKFFESFLKIVLFFFVLSVGKEGRSEEISWSDRFLIVFAVLFFLIGFFIFGDRFDSLHKKEITLRLM